MTSQELTAWNTYNQHGLEIINAGLITQTEFRPMGISPTFDPLFLKRYMFFQGYLDGPLLVPNSFFFFGTGQEYNAWALGDTEINIILVNAHVIVGNTLFYANCRTQIETVLKKLGISCTYDGGLPTVNVMRQLAEMYIFYHEVAHLIQMFELPQLIPAIRDERFNTNQFDIIDHIAEVDADLFASTKIATHVLEIIGRDKRRHSIDAVYVENLIVVVVSGFVLFRSLVLNHQLPFYTKATRHPHTLIRIFVGIADLTHSITQNSGYALDKKIVLDKVISCVENLCRIHPEISRHSIFTDLSKKHISLIKGYYEELIGEVKLQSGTAYVKKGGLGNR